MARLSGALTGADVEAVVILADRPVSRLACVRPPRRHAEMMDDHLMQGRRVVLEGQDVLAPTRDDPL